MAADQEIHRVPMLVGGEWVYSDDEYEIRDPYRGTVYSRAPNSSAADLDSALASSVLAKSAAASMPPWERAKLLRRAADILGERSDDLAEIMVRETGKPLDDCKVEVSRAPQHA